jgi:penicillin-binding protein 1A
MRVSGSLASSPMGPVAIDSVTSDNRDDRNDRKAERVFPAKVGEVAEGMLAGVVQGGTGKAAQIGEFAAGKTGTTENYGDAWFVGYNRQLTVAVWVGYPDAIKQMKTEYHGGPVAGGTYPAEIWHDFMTSFITVRDRRDAEFGKEREPEEAPDALSTPAPSVPQQEQSAEAPAAPESGGPEPEAPQKAPQQAPTPRQPSTPAQPQQPAPQAPAQAPTPAPGAGGGAAPTP